MARLLAGLNAGASSKAVACSEQGPCQNGGTEVVHQGYISGCDCPYGFSTRYCEYQCSHFYSKKVPATVEQKEFESSRSRIAIKHRGQPVFIILASDSRITRDNTMVAFGESRQVTVTNNM
eukprot:XP_011667200.1 PREDICTED: uncharacterized protein LOC105439667 [Strongylocentrotus purpuratus]